MSYFKRAKELFEEAKMVRRQIHQNPEVGFELPEIVEFIGKAFSAETKYDVVANVLVLMNTPKMSELVKKSAEVILGTDYIVEYREPLLASEDYAHIASRLPESFYFFVFCPLSDNDEVYAVHHPQVMFNEVEITMENNVILVLELIGTVAFAISGATVAIQKKMVLLGVCILGMTTAVDGGVIRDIFANSNPVIFQKNIYATASLIGAIVFVLLFSFNGYLAAIIGEIVIFILRVLAIKYEWDLPKVE